MRYWIKRITRPWRVRRAWRHHDEVMAHRTWDRSYNVTTGRPSGPPA